MRWPEAFVCMHFAYLGQTHFYNDCITENRFSISSLFFSTLPDPATPETLITMLSCSLLEITAPSNLLTHFSWKQDRLTELLCHQVKLTWVILAEVGQHVLTRQLHWLLSLTLSLAVHQQRELEAGRTYNLCSKTCICLDLTFFLPFFKKNTNKQTKNIPSYYLFLLFLWVFILSETLPGSNISAQHTSS